MRIIRGREIRNLTEGLLNQNHEVGKSGTWRGSRSSAREIYLLLEEGEEVPCTHIDVPTEHGQAVVGFRCWEGGARSRSGQG